MILIVASSAAQSAEPGATPVPAAVLALAGCWEGKGEVMGKPVAIAVSAYPIVQDAMLAIEVASSAFADPSDQYAAHLILGGDVRSTKASGATASGDRIVGYWADSFGGAFAAAGHGESRVDGFDMIYRYAEKAFVNRWRGTGDQRTWHIVAQNPKGVETPFASYVLHKTECRASSAP